MTQKYKLSLCGFADRCYFAQNDSDLQSHKEIIYAFVSKDKRFFSEYQKELTRNLPLYPSLELLLIDFAVT